jgi:tetratricopeptide (TPR) repeat protein
LASAAAGRCEAIQPAGLLPLGEAHEFRLTATAVSFEETDQPEKIAPAPEGEVYWRSAQSYLAAKELTGASAALNRFVLVEKNPDRLAEGWLALAETYAGLGEKDKSREAYYKCIEFPLTPFAFRARYQLALEEIDKKNYEQACEILMQNLESKGPGQDSSAREKTIYKIADLFYLLKDFDKAALYYEKAIQQYPRHPGVLAARDQLGECYYKLAKQAFEKVKSVNDEKKTYYQNARQHWLEQGALVCESLAGDLEHKARQSPLVEVELNLLRKALFGAAELKFEMNDFAEALRRYESLQDKYRKQVEGLIAGQRIWRFVGAMVDTPEQRQRACAAAVDAIKKIKADLDNMPEGSDALSGREGVWSKRRWEDWSRWVDDELTKLTLPPRVSVQ